MLRKVRRGCRSFGKSVRQALGCEKTYDEDAEIFSGSDAEDDSLDESSEDQKLREVDLLRPDLNAQHDYPSNAIRTARYTLVTAIPFSLLYQFHKVSNIFFLLVAVVALIPGASPINPFSSLVPLILVVGAGVIKDLWEDWKRHSADNEANSTRVQVLRDGEFVPVKSSEVQVGDVMLYRLGEEVRADCLILNTSLPDGLTYIETANLDGETNAKTRRAKIQTVQQLGTVEDIEELAFSGSGDVRCYSDAMAARPVKGMCAKYCGCLRCCGGSTSDAAASGDVGDVSSQGARSGIPMADARQGGGAGGRRRGTGSYEMCGRPGSPDRTSSVGTFDLEDGKPIKLKTLNSAPSTDQVLLYDGFEDERDVSHRHSTTDLPPRGRLGGYPDTSPLGDLATATMTVSADDMHDSGLDAGEQAADDAANNAVLQARAGGHGGDGPAGNVVGASPPLVGAPATGVHLLTSGLNPDLASWFGQIRLPSGEMVAVTIDQFLPRGCTVRNTEWVLGVVVYTGRHTKMMLNLRPKPNKTTVLSQRLNQINLFLLIFFLAMMMLVCALALRERSRMLKKTEGVRTAYSTWYIQYHLERHGDATLFWWRFLTNFVLLSYLIPLSLYVTLEFNKAMQMLMIGADNRMAVFDAFSGKLKHARPKSSELNNQLAQVQYIFTDKTGTLTENLMTYVGGYASGSSHDERVKPGGLGKVFLTETIPRMMEQSHVARMDRADALSLTTSSDDLHPLNGGTFSVAAATAAVAAAALSLSASRRAAARGGGDGEGEREEGDDAHHASFTGAAAAAATRDPRLAHKHRDLPNLDESVMERDELFRYLRALSLCHSVVCFKAPIIEEESDEAGDGAGDAGRGLDQDGAHSKSKTKDKKSKDKAETKKRKSARRSTSATAGSPREGSPDKHHRHGHHDKHNKHHDLTPEQIEKRAQRRARAAKRQRRQQLEQERQSRRDAVQSLAAMTPRADGSRVFIPNAVPINDSYKDLDSINNDAVAATVPARKASHVQPHSRTASAGAVNHSRIGSTVDLAMLASSTGGAGGLAVPLHGRTGSTGWYYSRLHAHSRNATNLSNTLGASGTGGGAAAAAALAAGSNPLEMYIDRTKIYEGQSLDEIALVSAARENGFSLYERTAKQLFVSVLGHIMCYDIIAELEFTPQRKLMSILVRRNPAGDSVEIATAASAASNTHYHRDKDGSSGPSTSTTATLNDESSAAGASFLNTDHAERPYLLLVKGADSSMLDIIDFNNPTNDAVRAPLMADLDEMAKTGLRTLILGQRIVHESEVKAWLPVFNEASCAMTHRSERMHEAYAMIEKNVDLIGTTAVEDKLQDGVPETLEFFSKASIIVWMLTGDKRETAVTIAQTSGLVAPSFADAMCHLDISDLLLEEVAAKHRNTHNVDPATTSTEAATTNGGDGGEATSRSSPHTTNVPPAAAVDHNTPEQIERRQRILAIRERMAQRIDSQLAAAETQCRESKEQHGASQCVLVVDGKTLDYIFSDSRRSRRFFDLGGHCRSAVCCRMTPLQKSSIVRMFQRNTKAVAVAVGDGANDVSMIQEARIGIGIMGLEGSQAELASDYAIPKFRFMKRLLFVHGRFSQYRDAHCILYSLYKNVLLTTGLCVYMFYCGFSGLSFIDSWLLAMFSIFFCSLQPLMIGILDKDVEDELAETLPAIYPPMARENMYFSFPYIVKWLLDGLIEGLLFFFFIYYTTADNEDLYRSGLMGGVEDYGQIFFTMMCLVCDLRVAVIISYYTPLFLIAVIFEIAMIPICEIVYAHINNLAGSNWCVLIADNLYASGKFWLFLLASCGVLAVYTMATTLYVQMFRPWINAGPAMNAMRASPYREEHDLEKAALQREYEQRLALQKQRELKALEEVERQIRESVCGD